MAKLLKPITTTLTTSFLLFIVSATQAWAQGCDESAMICNPLKSDSLLDFLQSLLDVIMVFAIPIIVFFIILAGFKYVTAQGNEYKISEASQALLYAVIGGLLILGAQVILAVIQGTISAF